MCKARLRAQCVRLVTHVRMELGRHVLLDRIRVKQEATPQQTAKHVKLDMHALEHLIAQSAHLERTHHLWGKVVVTRVTADTCVLVGQTR